MFGPLPTREQMDLTWCNEAQVKYVRLETKVVRKLFSVQLNCCLNLQQDIGLAFLPAVEKPNTLMDKSASHSWNQTNTLVVMHKPWQYESGQQHLVQSLKADHNLLPFLRNSWQEANAKDMQRSDKT